MKRFLLIPGVLVSSFIGASAQQPLPTPTSTPVPQQTPLFPRTGRGATAINIPPTFGANPDAVPDGLALRQMIVQKYAQPLYRKPTEKELTVISPPPEILKKYAAFLERENTGIFRLVVDEGCADNSKIVTATENCLKYTMPGAGNSYSFRTGNYRIRHLADLTYSNDSFRVTGILMHGIMVKLGDLPVESVSLRTPGVKYLVDFRPVTDFEKAKEMDQLLGKRIEQDGFVYSRIIAAADNTTYVLRAVAYQGKVYRTVRGAEYNEMDFDKRRDVIVVFRIVYRDTDGSLTIIWNELSNMNSPKMKMPQAGTTMVN